MVSYAIVVMLVIVFLTTAYHNFRGRGEPLLGSRILDQMIPGYAFFAPTPGTFDYHLMFRDLTVNETMGEWREVIDVQMSSHRPLWSGVWNPYKRKRKAIFDLVSRLLMLAQEPSSVPQEIHFSTPYLLLLACVSRLPASPLTSMRQFAIFINDKQRCEFSAAFVSGMHRLDDQPEMQVGYSA